MDREDTKEELMNIPFEPTVRRHRLAGSYKGQCTQNVDGHLNQV